MKEKLQAEVQTADDDTGMIVGAWFDKQETLSGKLYASVCERIYCLDEVPSHEQSSRYFGSDQSTKAEKKKRYIPDMNHPWKKDNFMKYVHAMGGREEHWVY